ncbi:unnamed protein product [Euphydryas editha]|uniref:Heparan-sulfate 6-O-sulfotransferase n=1 Tax=Euphydryas editha TaxID=104508 RepID=A0AAU9UIY3_EUPED|nr:unnamed protein product [Euphydryas editha]
MVCAISPRERMSESLALTYAEAPGRPLPDLIAQPGLSYDEVLHDDFRFDLNAHDVMVFLHIQKTGGTSFGRHLVMDLDLKVFLSLNCLENSVGVCSKILATYATAALLIIFSYECTRHLLRA